MLLFLGDLQCRFASWSVLLNFFVLWLSWLVSCDHCAIEIFTALTPLLTVSQYTPDMECHSSRRDSKALHQVHVLSVCMSSSSCMILWTRESTQGELEVWAPLAFRSVLKKHPNLQDISFLSGNVTLICSRMVVLKQRPCMWTVQCV